MLQTAQIRAARALLGWNQDDLAKASKVSIATIRRIESQEGPVMGYVSNLKSIQSALEKAEDPLPGQRCRGAGSVFG